MPEFNGAVALVTGGGGERGIGSAVSATLARFGARVAITDINIDAAEATAARLRAQGLSAQAFQHNVARSDDALRVVAEIEAQMGPIDLLVNNAGVSRHIDFMDIDEDEWNRVMSINVNGVFLTCKAVLPGMIERRRGRIVNMASICSKQVFPRFSHYCTSKYAVLGLTQAIAIEVAQYGITVNSVCPGVVDTPLQDALATQLVEGPSEHKSKDDVASWINSIVPLGRPQPAEDIAEMVAFLLSDHGRNMTGGSYHVDGGITPR